MAGSGLGRAVPLVAGGWMGRKAAQAGAGRPAERALHRRQHLGWRDVAHAAVMHEPAGRLVAGPAGHVGLGLDDGGERVERRPVPGAGRPEDADGRRADRGGDMHQAGIVRHRGAGELQRQDGVAQVRRGEVARGGAGGARRSRPRAGSRPGCPAPRPRRLRAVELARELGEIGDRPALARADRARREARRPAGRRPAGRAARAMLGRFGAGTSSSGSGQSAGSGAPFGSASAPQRSIMRGSCRSPKRMSLSRPKRTSPAKPVRCGNAGEERRQRRFPGPRHHQRAAVVLRRTAARPAPGAAAAPAACAAGRRRCPCARPACSRAAARTASWSGRRSAGPG